MNPLPTFGTGGTFATGTGTRPVAEVEATEMRRREQHRARRHVSRFQRETSRLRTLVRGGRGAPQTGRRDARYRPKAGIFELDGVPFQAESPLACDNWETPKPVITSAETFNQWYRTVDGVNYEIKKEIKLEETTNGSGQYVFESSAFFPLGKDEGFGITPAGNDLGKNFLFTTEIHVRFQYVTGQKFTFRGDDDLWIFVNGKLALDLGSTHGAVEGVIDFDEQAASLGLTALSSYPMDIFHAERHTRDSNFKLTTNISCFEPGAIVN